MRLRRLSPRKKGKQEQSVASTPVPGNDFFDERGTPEQWKQTNDFMNYVVGHVAPSSDSPRLLFVGDSIFYNLQANAEECWKKNFAAFSLNLAIMGDQTQHMLWRLGSGNLDGLKPDVVIVLAGTNNSLKNTAAETANGIQAIVSLIHTRAPGAAIILLELLPRTDDPLADAECQKVNVALRKAYRTSLESDNNVRLVSLEHVFRATDGSVPSELMPDGLHPSSAGYELMAQELSSTIACAMREATAADTPSSTSKPSMAIDGSTPPAIEAAHSIFFADSSESDTVTARYQEYVFASPGGRDLHLRLHLPAHSDSVGGSSSSSTSSTSTSSRTSSTSSSSSSGWPLVIAINGSGFYGGTAKLLDRPSPALGLVHHGFAVAQVEHRGSMECSASSSNSNEGDGGGRSSGVASAVNDTNGFAFPLALHDTKAAVRWLRGQAAELGIDAERFAAFGDSSGGWMASMLGLTGRNNGGGRSSGASRSSIDLEGAVGEQHFFHESSAVSCVLAFYPPTDLLRMDLQSNHKHPAASSSTIDSTNCTRPDDSDIAAAAFSLPPSLIRHDDAKSPEGRFLGGKKGLQLQQHPELAVAASPITYIEHASFGAVDSGAAGGVQTPVPFFIRHGDADQLVPPGQSQLLAQALRHAHGRVKHVATEDGTAAEDSISHLVDFALVNGAGHGGQEFIEEHMSRQVLGFLRAHTKPAGTHNSASPSML
jgi:beta-glucosidase